VRRLRALGFERQADRLARFCSLRGLGLPSATLLAGRLAPALGGGRLGGALVLRAVRRDPDPLGARLAAAKTVLRHQGPIVAWLRMKAWDERTSTMESLELRAAWLAQHATVYGHLRDFPTAFAILDDAECLAPSLPSVALARAAVLIELDRREEALDAALPVLSREPAHRAGGQLVAHLLLVLGRGEEAIERLVETFARTEDCRLARQLVGHLVELRRFGECLEWLDRYEAMAPLLDRREGAWLQAMRAGVRREQAETAPGLVAEGSSAAAKQDRRVLLPVPFVAQDRFTCSPATLTSIAAFWGRFLDHDALAEEICYDGTPRHRVRNWAGRHGFAVREFQVTWDSAREVLDRGVPFALVTKESLSGHDQAVVGYDERSLCLLVRCPSQPFLVHLPIRWLRRTQGWCGPRGTIVLPEGESARLDGLDLPDARAYDDLHALEAALADHRREGAEEILERLRRSRAGGHLKIWAALELAWYDGDDASALRWIECLIEAFPGTPALEMMRLRVQRRLVSPSAYVRMLAATCRRYRREPALHSMLALQLSCGANTALDAARVLRPLLRRGYWPAGAVLLAALANIRAHEGRDDDAGELVALAARLEDMQEWIASAYFDDAHRRGRAEAALEFLRGRQAEYGGRSGRPAETLFHALLTARGPGEAHSVLEEALSRRPGDHDLKLFAASALAANGQHDRADALLDEARGHTHRGLWLRAAAGVAGHRGFDRVSLELWREVLIVEPTAVDAHKAVADLLTQMGQASAANAHLRMVGRRYPHHYALAQLAKPA